MSETSKSEATSALRLMFGPTARISRVDVAGLRGVRVVARGAVVLQTFDTHGDVWRRIVLDCLPAATGEASA
jgi:hypothetical protein